MKVQDPRTYAPAIVQKEIDNFKKSSMNNNITEDYCSFEVSKLLKEKDFGVNSPAYYDVHNKLQIRTWANFADFGKPESQNGTLIYQAPYQSVAIKWIRENFGIHIYVDWTPIHKWFYCIHYLKNHDRIDFSQFKSVEEATEAALLYTLQNLIP